MNKKNKGIQHINKPKRKAGRIDGYHSGRHPFIHEVHRNQTLIKNPQ